KPRDRERIYEGIVDALKGQLPSRPEETRAAGKGAAKAPSAAEAVKALSRAQRQRFGDTAVRQVLSVAADHSFFRIFEESQLFIDVLKWLQRLRNDAEFNGFGGIMKEYKMDSSVNPTGDLARKLKELTDKALGDSFRVASDIAAKAILAEAASRQVPPRTGEGPARIFGRKLATLSVRDLVTRYIHSFVFEV